MSTKYSRAGFTAAVVVAFFCGLVFASGFDLTRFGWAQSRVANTPMIPAVASAAETETAFEAVVDHARPAVVSIETERFARRHPTSRRRGAVPPDLPPGMEDFFRQFQQQQPPSDQPEEASGSGFIVSKDGYILTNNHVVEDADRVKVTLFDKREFDNAKVVGRDPTTDVALIKIDGNNLPTVPLGDDATARVGEWVLAIGNPLQLNFTVTAGIVSAKGRPQAGLLNAKYAITDYIQTDAAINPGNSGGPLLDIHGNVIGINSAIESGTGFYTGYGFAIPITLAHQVMNDIIKYGKVRRAVLGVSIGEVSANDARAAGLATIGGAKVGSFEPEDDSPAKRAGMEVGDVIIAAGGHPVDQVSTLQRIIRGYAPGDVVDIDVMRFGQKETLHVKLGEPTDDTTELATADDQAPVNNDDAGRQNERLGITVGAVTSDIAQQMKLASAYRNGLLVTDVSPSGPAYHLFTQGDVILRVLYPRPARDVHTPQDLQSAVSGVKDGGVIEFEVYNAQLGQTRAVTVPVGK